MRTALCALIALFSLAAAPVAAGDFPTSYRVVQKDFKKGAVAGDQLSFTLFSDALCTDIVAQELVLAEDVELLSRLKLNRVKGGPKPPKVTELRHTLTDVDPSQDVFLEVTGPGVVPVGLSCQAQQATPRPGVFAFGHIREDASIRSASPEVDAVTNPATGEYCVTFLSPVTWEQLEGSVVGLGGSSTTSLHVRVKNGQGVSACPSDSLIVQVTNAAGLLSSGRFTFIVP